MKQIPKTKKQTHKTKRFRRVFPLVRNVEVLRALLTGKSIYVEKDEMARRKRKLEYFTQGVACCRNHGDRYVFCLEWTGDGKNTQSGLTVRVQRFDLVSGKVVHIGPTFSPCIDIYFLNPKTLAEAKARLVGVVQRRSSMCKIRAGMFFPCSLRRS